MEGECCKQTQRRGCAKKIQWRGVTPRFFFLKKKNLTIGTQMHYKCSQQYGNTKI